MTPPSSTPDGDTSPGELAGEGDQATSRAIEERTWLRPIVLSVPERTSPNATDEQKPPSGNVDVAPVDDLPVRRRRAASAPLEDGPRYELGGLIGRGGMGEVYAAYDAQIGREVAIKRLHPDKITPSTLARFLREARIQGWLDHPAIPSVYELDCDGDGPPYFVMKRLSGVTLDTILAARADLGHDSAISGGVRFSEEQLLRAFVDICLAIEFAHTRGVLHRDLKPANILLGEFGEVYVLDWGVACVFDGDVLVGDMPRHTVEHFARSAGTLGTPGYMSPEQVCGEELDGRADVYALGCVLFEILSWRPLHPAGFAGMTSALAGTTASPSTYRGNLAPELDELCRRATAVDRRDRIASARALGEAVQRYLDGDRDLVLRRELARVHLEIAHRASAESLRTTQGRRDATEVDTSNAEIIAATAMRAAGRALALDPTLPGAAELVGRLMIRPPVHTPAAVLADIEESERPEQMRMAKIALGIYAGYACLAPLLFAFGIRDVPYLCALVVIAIGNVAIAGMTLARRRCMPRFVVAIGQAAMFALIARMFTPLFVAPAITALTLMGYAQHPAARRRELLGASAVAVAAVLGVLGAEACGWLSSTIRVVGGSVRIEPPLEGIAQFPIIPALCCYLIVLVAVVVEFAYSAAQRGRDARRELHIQAWRLRQLVSLDSPRLDPEFAVKASEARPVRGEARLARVMASTNGYTTGTA